VIRNELDQCLNVNSRPRRPVLYDIPTTARRLATANRSRLSFQRRPDIILAHVVWSPSTLWSLFLILSARM